MAKTYYDQDVNWEVMKGKTVAIIGYGSQGHAHALNLKESGVDVVVGLYEGSKSKAAAEAHDLKVLPVAEAVKQADVTMVLIPDEKQADVYKEEIGPNLKPGSALAFAHGFNIHFKQIVPPAGIDVFMVAPKGPGHLVRRTFEEGSGVPASFRRRSAMRRKRIFLASSACSWAAYASSCRRASRFLLRQAIRPRWRILSASTR